MHQGTEQQSNRTAPTTPRELIEALADIEHQRWGDWQQYVHSLGKQLKVLNVRPMDPAVVLVIDIDHIEHWDRLIATLYADLPEHSKQSDRDQVMRYWPLIVEFVAAWLEQASPEDFQYDIPARVWREEMSNG